MATNDIIDKIGQILEARKRANPETSYVSELYKGGLDRILEKIEEESAELIVAASDAEKSKKTDEVIHETADLWFHTLVLLAYLNESPHSILNELQKRFGTSGLTEKASRSTN